ncbi:cbb3-type cytochrome c oxidase subunit 3 [Uliginosibacterium sp. 31-16]|uniref:cbb3-type cytochrome oxidase subunit 3 n=1 Tax=Uliginosibacterium sp. 31-16 TaxID=3068315 RepID=UPI00273D1D2F|nr:cbb3-type cytochrome c oxidase subunit 3 [Uliginosibacterium sp. 31-16]MDP5240129.1 cbb3-type cytochrome c oxidase subunit 3 [Uliginosibacterium sp. 31-16]
MDIDSVRSLVTVLGMTCFLAIVFWAYSRSAKKGFEEAAMLPFHEDDEVDSQSASRSHTQG